MGGYREGPVQDLGLDPKGSEGSDVVRSAFLRSSQRLLCGEWRERARLEAGKPIRRPLERPQERSQWSEYPCCPPTLPHTPIMLPRVGGAARRGSGPRGLPEPPALLAWTFLFS